MNWNKWIRQIHRWLSIAFTMGVCANIVEIFGLKQSKPSPVIGLAALLPLVLLLASGLYLFVLPHAASWRSARRARA